MSKKILKAEYVSVINYYFRKQGKKISNISKATIPKLKELINTYNIDFSKIQIEKDRHAKEQGRKLAKKEEELNKEVQAKIKKEKEEKRMTKFIRSVQWFRRSQNIKKLYNNPNKQTYYKMFKLKQEEELVKNKQTALIAAMKMNKRMTNKGKIVLTDNMTNIVYPHLTVNVSCSILNKYGNEWYNDIYNHLDYLGSLFT